MKPAIGNYRGALLSNPAGDNRIALVIWWGWPY